MKTRWMPAAFALAGLIALTGLTGSAKAGFDTNSPSDKYLKVDGAYYDFIRPPSFTGPNPISKDMKAVDIANSLKENENYAWVTEELVGENIWKWDLNPKEGQSPYSGSESGLYEVLDGSASGGTISRTGLNVLDVSLFETLFLVVKDGNEGSVIFDLLGAGNQAGPWVTDQGGFTQTETDVLVNWNGVDDIHFKSPFSGGERISNVAMWGSFSNGGDDPEDPSPGPPITVIPEPATSIVWLISACLCGLFIHRRVRRLRVA